MRALVTAIRKAGLGLRASDLGIRTRGPRPEARGPARARALSLSIALTLCGSAAFAQAPRAQGDDDESALLVNEARADVAGGRYDKAAVKLDRALALNPRRVDAYVLRAGVHAAKKEFDRGVALMRKAQALAPDNLDVLTALGTDLVLAGDAKEGAPLLEKVIARAPERYDAHAILGDHYAANGEYERAATELGAYLKTRPDALRQKDDAIEVALADAELRAGRAAEARARFGEVLKRRPKDVKAQLGQAWASAAVSCAEAQPLLEKLAPLSPRYPEILLVQGRCALSLGRADEARGLADRFLARAGDRGAAGHALRGEALLAAGDVKGARAELGEALRLAPDSRRIAIKLARAERLGGDAVGAVKRLGELGPGGREPGASAERVAVEYALELAEAQLATGDAGGAAETILPQVEKHPEDAQVLTVAGAAFVARGNPERALDYLAPAVAHDPSSAWARTLYVGALIDTSLGAAAEGKLDLAEKGLARAVDTDGTNGPALRALGAVRLAVGKPGDAEPVLAKAVNLAKGKDAAALLLYGRALAAQKRWDEARKALEQALPLVPPERTTDTLAELAATDLDAGDPARGVARIEPLLAQKKPAIDALYLTLARAAAEKAMAQGAFGQAVRLLERAEKLAKGETLLAVRCHLALAATAGGERDVALARLRELDRPGVRCPFPAPADELVAPVLAAVNSATDSTRAEAALTRLAALSRRASGAADRLIDDATRWVAARAAADAYARGQIEKARRYLAIAAKTKGATGPELLYDQAVLDLEAGEVDAATRVFERVAPSLPEAFAALGVARERKGQASDALELYQKAAAAGAKVPRLKEWIESKQRVLGGAP